MVSSVAERICALLLLVGTSYCAVAQEEMNSAFVTVAVSDTLGGAIPNARVHVLQHLSKSEKEKLTDETGNATLELQPGRFDLTVTCPPGFLKLIITNVDVQRSEHRRMNVVLMVKTSDCCIDPVPIERIELESANVGDLEEPTKQSPREQMEFGSDSDLDHPIPVPQTALDALRSALKATPDELPGEELKASEIHLAGQAETDLIVPRAAGHAAFFYILRPTASGYKLIFDSGGDGMTVLRTRSHGYRDLRVWGFTQAGRSQSTAIYKFNGLGYIKVREKTEHIN